MARPRKSDEDSSAYERISEAFWQELSEKEYAKITIRGLAKRAGVNHNLLYYYFENIDDMAMRFFEENTSAPFSAQYLVQALLQGEDISPLIDASTALRMNRARLFVRGDSAYLMGIFQDAALRAWLGGSGLEWEVLSPEEKLDLRFIIGGLTAVLGKTGLLDSPSHLLEFTKREVGCGVKATLNRIRKRRH